MCIATIGGLVCVAPGFELGKLSSMDFADLAPPARQQS
jgi:hypothetical protein